jgi:hypothetical protein
MMAMLALVVGMSMAAPMTAFATEAEETGDILEDEETEGEQTTVMAEPEEGSASTPSTGSTSSAASSTASSTAKSSDSSLAHLGISPGTLSPAFSSGTHEYTATVDAGVTRISVAAKPNSSKAVIAAVNGAKSIQAGTNTVKVVVEAENGATTTYTITVTCGTAMAQSSDDTSAAVTQDAEVTGDATETDAAETNNIEGSVEELSGEEAVTFDDNGYLVYEGETYIPSAMMPEGEYVSLSKYNNLYDQSQSQSKSYMRLVIVLVILLVVLVLVIVNLIFKLRDQKADAALGLGVSHPDRGAREAEKKAAEPEIEEDADSTGMIENVSIPDSLKADLTGHTAHEGKKHAEKKPVEKKAVEKKHPEKKAKKSKEEDFEILDLNDL